MNNEERKFVLVTGTSSGIGKPTAEELLNRGWDVIGIARREVNIHHNNYIHLKCDLSKTKHLETIVNESLKLKLNKKKYQRVALVNNAAGTGELLKIEHLIPEKLMDLYVLNVITPIWLIGFFLKNRPQQSKLRVINISTGAARNAYPGMSAYCGTKAALLMSGKVFASENSLDQNLAIRSYEPGTVNTEMQEKARSQPPDKFPSVNLFKSMKADNALIEPFKVAVDIVEFLEDNSTGYSEKRFG